MAEKALEQTVEKQSFGVIIARYRELGLLGFIILLTLLVQTQNSSFLSIGNILNLLTNTSILIILAIGMMLVIITRGIDLSIGATLALSGMVAAQTISANPHLNPIVVLLLGILVGTICGAVIGLLVSKGGVLPIIATLGMMNVYRGLTFSVSEGKWVSAHQMPDSFKTIATNSVLGINTLIIIAVGIILIAIYFINHTRTGRQIYAVGSNPDSAKISGINNKKIIWLVYTIMGSLSGLSGVLWVSKFASAQPDTAMGYELSVIAACVLGGVSIAGGVGKVSGVILGAILLGILNNALPLIGVSPFWQMAIQGSIFLFAVLVNVFVKRGVERNNLMRRKI